MKRFFILIMVLVSTNIDTSDVLQEAPQVGSIITLKNEEVLRRSEKPKDQAQYRVVSEDTPGAVIVRRGGQKFYVVPFQRSTKVTWGQDVVERKRAKEIKKIKLLPAPTDGETIVLPNDSGKNEKYLVVREDYPEAMYVQPKGQQGFYVISQQQGKDFAKLMREVDQEERRRDDHGDDDDGGEVVTRVYPREQELELQRLRPEIEAMFEGFSPEQYFQVSPKAKSGRDVAPLNPADAQIFTQIFGRGITHQRSTIKPQQQPQNRDVAVARTPHATITADFMVWLEHHSNPEILQKIIKQVINFPEIVVLEMQLLQSHDIDEFFENSIITAINVSSEIINRFMNVSCASENIVDRYVTWLRTRLIPAIQNVIYEQQQKIIANIHVHKAKQLTSLKQSIDIRDLFAQKELRQHNELIAQQQVNAVYVALGCPLIMQSSMNSEKKPILYALFGITTTLFLYKMVNAMSERDQAREKHQKEIAGFTDKKQHVENLNIPKYPTAIPMFDQYMQSFYTNSVKQLEQFSQQESRRLVVVLANENRRLQIEQQQAKQQQTTVSKPDEVAIVHQAESRVNVVSKVVKGAARRVMNWFSSTKPGEVVLSSDLDSDDDDRE